MEIWWCPALFNQYLVICTDIQRVG
jgi:hypothetical protein